MDEHMKQGCVHTHRLSKCAEVKRQDGLNVHTHIHTHTHTQLSHGHCAVFNIYHLNQTPLKKIPIFIWRVTPVLKILSWILFLMSTIDKDNLIFFFFLFFLPDTDSDIPETKYQSTVLKQQINWFFNSCLPLTLCVWHYVIAWTHKLLAVVIGYLCNENFISSCTQMQRMLQETC